MPPEQSPPSCLTFVLGTRPEIIKLAPVMLAARRAGISCKVIHTGQHYSEGLDGRFFQELGLPAPDRQLGVGSEPPGLQVAHMLLGLHEALAGCGNCIVVVQGDTNSTLAGAIAAKKRGLPLAHVEAGLRSFDRRMPEESNRIQVDILSDWLFCPTELQREILRRENGAGGAVAVVGNTIADAVAGQLAKAGEASSLLARFGVETRNYAFLTLHREENVDDAATLRGLIEGVDRGTGAAHLKVLFPVHPRTQKMLLQHGVTLPASIKTLEPVGFTASLLLQREARIVLTDSGGLQEEASILGTPCVTLRTSTERPETVDVGGNLIAGVDAAGVARAIGQALAARRRWQHPYGDGRTAERIVAVLQQAMQSATGAVAAKTVVPAAPALPSDGDWTGRSLGEQEIQFVARAIRSGTLNSTKGTFVARFEREFGRRHGGRHAIACASGTAAMHCAVAALALKAGDEVVTTPITDMGALTPILYEGAIPVFADVDPATLNVTAATLAAKLTSRTRAIVVTHLFGLPCEMKPIQALAREKGLPIIEDCAQAFLAESDLGRVGTLGHIAAFSMQQGKHMTTGEGGIVLTSDDQLARRVFLFVNKAWGYGDANPDHSFPALNYRLTELQGAVALAQLDKLEWVLQRRREVAGLLSAALAGIAGVSTPVVSPGTEHAWWRYAIMIDPAIVRGGAFELGKRIKDRGVACVPRYIQKPAFECGLFADWNASPVTALPLRSADGVVRPQPVYRRSDYPGAVQALDRVIVLPINEHYTPEHVRFVAAVIREEAVKSQAPVAR
ncbi:MAG TPA: UDP-N-acetylglucosamine 2-epimerase (non-hydrolyzing) [Planctomycetota bacterium]|nr:UDP-N-acetylglucosamine 2-epimerase (non-hydrolyzing) [Planctomycetota bacterium]